MWTCFACSGRSPGGTEKRRWTIQRRTDCHCPSAGDWGSSLIRTRPGDVLRRCPRLPSP